MAFYTGSIKISQLDPILSGSSEDFFPMVVSSSMTTYRMNLGTVKGIFNSSSWDSASYSFTSSYAVTSSHALLAKTASYYNVVFPESSSWSSASISSSYAKTASYTFEASHSVITTNLSGGYALGTTADFDMVSIGIRVPTVNDSTGYLILKGASNDNLVIRISGSMDDGTGYFTTGDNGTEPFNFGGNGSTDGYPRMTWMTMETVDPTGATPLPAVITAYGEFSASVFSSSKSNAVGFYGTASYAIYSSYAVSSSLASTASYINPSILAGLPKAWANFIIPSASFYSSNPTTGNTVNKPIVVSSYNVSDISWIGDNITPNPIFVYPGTKLATDPNSISCNLLVTLTNALSNVTYSANGSMYEEGSNRFEFGNLTCFSQLTRTTSKFTMSLANYNIDQSGTDEQFWGHFTVF